MTKRSLRQAISACALPVAFASIALPALAAEKVIEEVVVTGSFIRGTPQDTALPVDVLNAQDLVDQGSPTITEMIRNLNVSNGNLGETNQFNASGGQGNEGVATVNLRGLGSSRTLVLINGRRQVSTSSIGVDISAIPTIAIGRLEVLKDGAAALYGSDAIAGVTNFITRADFTGAEVRASGQTFKDTDGEYTMGVMLGGDVNDKLHVTGAFEYEHRSEVKLKDLGWAVRPLASNPQSGISGIGNPGTLYTVGATGINGVVPDPGCTQLGNILDGSTCRFQFTNFDNLVEKQDTYKAFSELNYDINENSTLHVEALYSKVDIPKWATSPSYPPQSLFGPDRFIPLTHPGLVDLLARNPGLFPAGTVGVFPVERANGAGGYVNGEPRRGSRETDTYRLAVGLKGNLFQDQLGYDLAVSYSRRDRDVISPDMYVERMALALDGLGGPNCDPATGTPGVGDCMYHTFTSNGVGFSALTGQTNPDANPDLVAMNNALKPWLEDDVEAKTRYELLVWDATFNGETGIELPGGTVGWAFGLQARNEKYELTPSALTDLNQNPCPFVDPVSVTLGNTDTLDCTQSLYTSTTGRFAFLSGTYPSKTKRTVFATFLELGLPITDRLNGQLAVRFEDYGSQVGSTIDPKLALRFQATDDVILRGSISTTFRGPPQDFLEGRGTSLQFVGPANAFKAVDTNGNPALSSETALATNFGVVFDHGPFFASLDYWRFDFKDPIQVEDFNAIVGAFSSYGCAAGGAGVGTATCDSLSKQIVFQPGLPTTPGNIQRVNINYINGGDVTTDGVDWFAQYDLDTDYGLFQIGSQGTWTNQYDVGDFQNIDGVFLQAGGDYAGNLNDNRNTITPIVDLQANAFVKYTNGIHRATVTGRYWGNYHDDGAIPSLQTINSMFTTDVNYNISLMEDALSVNLSVFNLFDVRPPQAQTDLNYDPYTHSPYGRMIKLGLTYRM